MTGRILWWSDRDQNGIIVTNHEGREIEWYFDSSVLKCNLDGRSSRKATVTFEQNTSIEYCRCAMNVRLTND